MIFLIVIKSSTIIEIKPKGILSFYWLNSLKFSKNSFFCVDLIGLISIPPLLKNLPHISKWSTEKVSFTYKKVFSIQFSWNPPWFLRLNKKSKISFLLPAETFMLSDEFSKSFLIRSLYFSRYLQITKILMFLQWAITAMKRKNLWGWWAD